MNRTDLPELHFMTLVGNVQSILRHGILSKNEIAKKGLKHKSVASKEVQDLRDRITVPGGRPLHDYANLYLCGRNPMLFRLCCQGGSGSLCVLRITTEVLDIEGAIVTDGNAASEYIGFWPSSQGLKYVSKNLLFAKYWTATDRIQQLRKKTAKCAELLVPERVPPEHILGAYVSGQETCDALMKACPGLEVTIDSDLFFGR